MINLDVLIKTEANGKNKEIGKMLTIHVAVDTRLN